MDIKLQGVKNIRDFTEYGFQGYIRSAHLHDMTESDAESLLKDYKLRMVIDLRTGVEKNEQPDHVMEGVEYLHIPLFNESRVGISHEKSTQQDMDMMLPDMPDLYRKIVTDEFSVAQIKKVMEAINARRDGAVLWHCTEGKDRCGIISALFLLSRGIDKDTVMQDYLKTNEASGKKAEYYYAAVLEKSGSREIAEKVKDAFLAKREYMEPVIEILISQSRQYFGRD